MSIAGNDSARQIDSVAKILFWIKKNTSNRTKTSKKGLGSAFLKEILRNIFAIPLLCSLKSFNTLIWVLPNPNILFIDKPSIIVFRRNWINIGLFLPNFVITFELK